MIGTTLSHYEIIAELGRGGMGMVYKARDTKLDRDVAIKVLPAAALASEDDRARFYREAKAAAALNHPNIAAIHQIDEAIAVDADGNQIEASDGPRPFIAMEFIEGGTLEDRIKQGPMKLDEVVGIAIRIAEALRAAHTKDIVHRDIKSANIMLTADGQPKVLDFGLAQTAASTKLTRMGSTLGTVAYMSPEQARGEEVDGRSDLYSLGTVLYEMIAGRLPFGGEYEQAVVYGILNEDPEPLTAIRTGVPMELEQVVAKLLRKDRKLRYPSADGVIADLEAIRISSSSTSQRSISAARPVREPASRSARSMRTGLLVGLGVVTAIAAFLAGSALSLSEPQETRIFQETIPGLESAALSPDGRMLGWMARDTLWVRSLSNRIVVPMTATREFRQVEWGRTSDHIVFVDGREVKLARTDGSGITNIGTIPPAELVHAIIWTPDDRIVLSLQYGGANGEVLSFPVTGGEPESIRRMSTSSDGYSVRGITWMAGPDVLIISSTEFDQHRVRVLNPTTDAERELDAALQKATESSTALGASISHDERGYLLYQRDTDTWALRVHPKTGMPQGDPFIVFSDLVAPRASSNGSMSAIDFGTPDDRVELVLFDPATGTHTGTGLEHAGFSRNPLFSPSGDQVLLADAEAVWLMDLRRGGSRKVSTGFSVLHQWPRENMALTSEYMDGNAAILMLNPAATEDVRTLIDGPNSEFHPSLSPDGRTLMYYEVHPETGRDLWYVGVEESASGLEVLGEATPWYTGSFDDAVPDWHPSGNWLAYMSNESGRFQVYVRSFPDGSIQRAVSIGEGASPRWSNDGNTLYYLAGDSLFAVPVLDEASMELGRPSGFLSSSETNMQRTVSLEYPYAVRPGTGEIMYFRYTSARPDLKVVIVDNWLEGLGQ